MNERTAETLARQIAMDSFEVSKCHPDDTAFELPNGDLPGIAGRVRTRYFDSLANDQWRFCSHLIAHLEQPMFVRTWKWLRTMCVRCLPTIVSAPTEHPCDECGLTTRPVPLLIQTFQVGTLLLYFGLCLPCLERMQAELRQPNG